MHLVKFYNQLKKYKKDNFKSYDKRTIFNMVYPGEPFNDQKLRSLESDLSQLGSDYLFFENNKQHTAEKEIFLIKQYRERQMHKSFEFSIKRINKIFEGCIDKDWNYYYMMLKVKYEEITKMSDNHKNSLSEYFEEADRCSDKLFLHLKLSILNSMNNRRLIPSSGFDDKWWFSAVYQYINGNIRQIEKNEKSIYLEFLISQLKKNTDPCRYDKFMDFVISNMNSFSDDNLKYIMGTFTGYHIELITKNGYSGNFRIFFNDMKRLVENGIYENQKIIFHTEFMNIILTASAFSEIRWAEEFRNRYLNKVNEEFYTEAEKLSEAYILFGKKKFTETLCVLNRVKSTTSYFYGYIKVLIIKCYYELDQIENLIYSLEALKKFIQRRKAKRIFDIANINMVLAVYKLIDAKDPCDAEKLKMSVEANPLVGEINWIKEKISEKNNVTFSAHLKHTLNRL
jgi:hypothetical protein